MCSCAARNVRATGQVVYSTVATTDIDVDEVSSKKDRNIDVA